MSSGTLFTRLPGWLRQALATQEPDVPNILGAIVDPVLDVGQGGWGLVEPLFPEVTHPASTGATNYTLIAQDPDVTPLLLVVTVAHFGGAGAADVTLTNLVGAGSTRALHGFSALAAGPVAGLGHRQTVRQVVLPPGSGLRVDMPATGVGESLTCWLSWLPIRRGFKPI